jgi:hypothetical protein
MQNLLTAEVLIPIKGATSERKNQFLQLSHSHALSEVLAVFLILKYLHSTNAAAHDVM